MFFSTHQSHLFEIFTGVCTHASLQRIHIPLQHLRLRLFCCFFVTLLPILNYADLFFVRVYPVLQEFARKRGAARFKSQMDSDHAQNSQEPEQRADGSMLMIELNSRRSSRALTPAPLPWVSNGH